MLKKNKGQKTYYEILKISPNASDVSIRKAYVALARVYHPDKNSGNKKIAALRFRLINEAYAALKTQSGRERYNRLLLQHKTKPKGLKLSADNDNTDTANDRGLFRHLINLFASPKSSNQRKS